MSEHDAQYRKACEQCRNRKLKCTGERPTCARCAKSSGTECLYLPNAPTGRPSKRARTTTEERSPFTPVVQNDHIEQNGHGHGHGHAYGGGLEGTAGINDADLTQMLDLEFGMGDGMTSEMIRDAEGMAFVMNGMPITNFGIGVGISSSSPWDFGNYSDTIPQPQPQPQPQLQSQQQQQQQHQFYGHGGAGYGHGQIQSPQQQQAVYTPTMESPSMMGSYTPTMTPGFSPSLQQRQLGTPLIPQPLQHMPVPVPVPAPIPIPAPAPVEVQLPAAVAEQEPPKSSCCCSSKKKTTITTSSLPPAASEIKPEPAPLPPPPAPVPKSCPATSIRTICVPDADGCPCGSNTTNLLISLRRIIRNAADEEAKAATPESPEIQSSSKNEGGANSLSIALSIAQSATTQCSCSANCTNCASDPSLPLTSATVLGLALQVYLQAIRVLQSQSQKSVEGLEVMVGGFRVGPRNARRVALYATGLELRGLRGAMDEVIRRGDGNGNGDEEEGEGEGEGEGQGVVGIMVGKMRRQLGRAIETVDRMLREAEEEGA